MLTGLGPGALPEQRRQAIGNGGGGTAASIDEALRGPSGRGGAAVEARRLLGICWDALLLFPGGVAGSSGRGRTTTAATKHNMTIKLLNDDH